ncbi:S1 family peptidase [Nocardia sp. NPDC051030]|uniref:S1 family peptidase n=1 Tax=Nocardia sp. NPDC051030 TaxID=3155162 RepID=UPI003447C9E6
MASAGVTAAYAEPAPGPDLPAALIAALDRDLHIDAERYLARAESAQRLADFETTARLAYPMTLAGVWMDGDIPVVGLADGTSREQAGRTAERAGFTVRRVTDSAATLHKRRDAVTRWAATQPAAIAASILDGGIDYAGNAVTVRAVGHPTLPAELGPVRVLAAGQSVRGPLRVPVESPSTPVLAATTAGGEMSGGQAYWFPMGGGYKGGCSLGFNGTDAQGNTVFVTAGHCDPMRNDPGRDSEEQRRVYRDITRGPDGKAELGTAFGHFATSNLGPYDYGIVRVHDQFAANFQNNLVSAETKSFPTEPGQAGAPGSGGGSNLALPSGSGEGATAARTAVTATAPAPVHIDGVASPVIGAPVCKSGMTTGYTCGTITAVDRVGTETDGKTTNTFEGFFIAQLCAYHGDSGGSVITGTKALGMSASGRQGDGYCAADGTLNVQPIGRVLTDNPGLRIRTS